MVSIANMRAHVEAAYDSDSWKRRVRLMPDRQVIAIYRSMLNRGRLTANKRKKKRKDEPQYEQLCMF